MLNDRHKKRIAQAVVMTVTTSLTRSMLANTKLT